MMQDSTLPPVVQKLNYVHHQDEKRHIAMGRRVVRMLHDDIVGKYPEEVNRRIDSYLRRYMDFFVQSLYNPSAYRDAGLPDPYEWRNNLISDPAREGFHGRVLRKPMRFFRSQDLLQSTA